MDGTEDCGLVSTRKKGKWNHYSLNRDRWTSFREYIESVRDAGENKKESGCCG